MHDFKRILSLPYWLLFLVLSTLAKLFGASQEKISKYNFRKNMGYWFLINGNDRYLLNHKIDSDAVVFEVGGYTGIFTADIYSLYGCTVHAFEPVQKFVKELHSKFDANPKVHIHPFGLGARSEKIKINLIGDKSSILREGEKNLGTEEISIVDIADFMRENDIAFIDLMTVNIEGGEYELLERLLETSLIEKVGFLQVQFHDVVENAESKRLVMVEKISKTHEKVFSVPFVWDGFRSKSNI